MKARAEEKSGNKITMISPESLVKKEYAKQFSGVHPAASIFPLAGVEEFEAICKDIEENGLIRPIVRDKHTKLLVDGRTRLMACHATGTIISVEDVESPDYIQFCSSANLARKHWSKQQLGVIGAKIANLIEITAKKKIGGDKKSLPKKLGNDIADRKENESAVKAGKQFNVNSDYVQKAKTVIEFAPDLIKEVETNRLDLKAAFKQAQVVKRTLKQEQKKTGGNQIQVPIIDVNNKVLKMVDEPVKHKFNIANDHIDWANWTWNPVTGCNHGCDFCYAREIASNNRFKNIFPVGFEPAFHEHRLKGPTNTKIPNSNDPNDKRVFVCSMADLFGKWIPDEWITKVFDACMTNPEWEYLFLTKWPNRYKMLTNLPKAWFGASVIKQANVLQVEKEMQKFTTTGIKWLSVEPMLERIKFNDLSWCDLVVIGSQTATNQPEGHVPAKPVEFEWVYDLVSQCKQFGVPYYLKANLDNGGTIWTKQQPNRRATLALAS